MPLWRYVLDAGEFRVVGGDQFAMIGGPAFHGRLGDETYVGIDPEVTPSETGPQYDDHHRKLVLPRSQTEMRISRDHGLLLVEGDPEHRDARYQHRSPSRAQTVLWKPDKGIIARVIGAGETIDFEWGSADDDPSLTRAYLLLGGRPRGESLSTIYPPDETSWYLGITRQPIQNDELTDVQQRTMRGL